MDTGFRWNMKKNLIIRVEKINKSNADNYLNNIELISDKTNSNIVTQLLFSDNDKGYAYTLKLDLIDIENCKYAYEVSSGEETEVVLVGKVKNISLNVLFDEKENIVSLDYNIPIAIPEVEQVQLDVENIIIEER